MSTRPGEAAGPARPDPQQSQPREAGPQVVGPQQSQPREAGPREAGPREAGPREAGPRDVAPHRYRQIAESFGVDPERYDRTRPRYPEALVARILAASSGRDVLDVGCGTGTAARQFQAAGATVLGVEPDARMAGYARASGIAVEEARFEEWQPAGRYFDAVVAGTAWHWVDPVAGALRAAQVLRPGGLLAPFWHVFEVPPAVAEAFAAVYHRVMPDAPVNLQGARQGLALYQPLLTRVAGAIKIAGGFGVPEQWQYDWRRVYTRDEWLEQLPTSGVLTRLPPDVLAQVLDGVGAAIDGIGGTLPVAYTTVAVTATRT